MNYPINAFIDDVKQHQYRTNFLNQLEILEMTEEIYLAQHPESAPAPNKDSDYLRDWTQTGEQQADWILKTLFGKPIVQAFSSHAFRTRKLAMLIYPEAQGLPELGLCTDPRDRVTAMSQELGHRGVPLGNWLDHHPHGEYMLAHGLLAWNAIFSRVQPYAREGAYRIFVAGHSMQLSAMIYAIGVLFGCEKTKAFGRVENLAMGDMYHLTFMKSRPNVTVIRCPKFE